MQIDDALQQYGIPEWILIPAAQRTIVGMLFLALINIVALPIVLLLRAEHSDWWAWPITLTPLWILDVLYAALLALLLTPSLASSSTFHSLQCEPVQQSACTALTFKTAVLALHSPNQRPTIISMGSRPIHGYKSGLAASEHTIRKRTLHLPSKLH